MTQSAWMVAMLAVGTLACASAPAKIHAVGNTSTYVVDYNSGRRGAYVQTQTTSDGKSRTTICAEPSPDVAVAMTADITARLQAAAQTQPADVNAKISEQIVDLARRGQTLQIQREALYRLCELQANAGLDAKSSIAMYQEVIKAIQAIAFSEFANSKLPEKVKEDLLKGIVKGDVLKP